MTLMMAVPIREGDVELFGDDPYFSARSWNESWMQLRAAAQAVVDAAYDTSDPSYPGGRYLVDQRTLWGPLAAEIDVLKALLEGKPGPFDSKAG